MPREIFTFGTKSYTVSDSGDVYSSQKKCLLAVHDNGNGYKTCTLWDGEKARKFYIHRLVATCFLPNPDGLPHVNHIDGDKSNNHVSNLEWVSIKDNLNHAHDTGLFDNHNKQIKLNQMEWIGTKNSTREVIGVTNEKNKAGNYIVWVRCQCGNELRMYMNDFVKDKSKSCRKCRVY